jgi:hypothetical protein
VPAPGSTARDRAAHAAIRASFGPDDRGTVLNFLGVGADPAWVRAAFEPEAYEDLLRLKKRADPADMFRIGHRG